jgi:hypothetical protein
MLGRLLLLVLIFVLGLASVSHLPPVGSVRDEVGPVVGASVRLKATSRRSFSDFNGLFSPVALSGRLTASKVGYFIAGRDAKHSLNFRLRRLPTEDHEGYVWVDPDPDATDPGRCGNCHKQIHQEWHTSGHARSATSPRFLAFYSDEGPWSLAKDRPEGMGVCSSCHAPTVSEDDPAFFDLRQIRGTSSKGVHCDYCHKVSGLNEGEIGLTHGRYLLKLLRPKEGQLFFGPLDDVDRNEDTWSGFQRDSRACAACHEGVVFGVHVYSTYSEWLQSPARRQNRQCQSCHMKPTGEMDNIAPGRGGVRRAPQTLGNHHFFDTSKPHMLRQSLRVEPRVEPSLGAETKQWKLRVRITARDVGHRVPTGYVDRHLLLVVEVDPQVKLLEGPTIPEIAGKELSGKPGRLFAKALQHNAESPAPFWRGASDVVDTRLHPDSPETFVFTFAGEPKPVRVRVLHRRFWADIAAKKGLSRGEIVVYQWSSHGASSTVNQKEPPENP